MESILKMVIKNFSRSYTQYRFDKISNFLTYEEFQEKEAIDRLIQLGKELERIKDFKKNSTEELKAMVQVWHDGENVGMSNELFAKYKGIDAQLSKAIEVILKELEEYNPEVPPIPPFPDKSGGGEE